MTEGATDTRLPTDTRGDTTRGDTTRSDAARRDTTRSDAARRAAPGNGAGNDDARPGAVRTWLLATRPATLLAGVAPVLIGVAFAAHDGVFALLPALAALVGSILIQIGTNLANDYFDFRKGADTADRLGPARVTQRGWLTPRQVLTATILTFALAFVAGLYLVAHAGWPLLVVGLVSIACGILYTGGPWPLGYLGLGDIFVLVFFGPVAVLGTYYVQAHTLSTPAFVGSLTVGLLSTAILVVNNLRDRVTDVHAGKRTLAVRFGPGFARAEYLVTVLAPYAIVAASVATGLFPTTTTLVVVTLPLALKSIAAVNRRDGQALNPMLGATARLTALFAIALCVGLLWQLG